MKEETSNIEREDRERRHLAGECRTTPAGSRRSRSSRSQFRLLPVERHPTVQSLNCEHWDSCAKSWRLDGGSATGNSGETRLEQMAAGALHQGVENLFVFRAGRKHDDLHCRSCFLQLRRAFNPGHVRQVDVHQDNPWLRRSRPTPVF